MVGAIARSRAGRLVAPAWFDEARLIVQAPRLRGLLGERQLRGRVLNAGCGEGLYSAFIEGFAGVAAIVNVDRARPSIARRGDPRHRDLQGTLTALPFGTAAFDAIVCTEVLEHIPQDEEALAEIARVLKTGGLLVVSVPLPPAPRDPAHVREGYTPQALSLLLERNGLNVVASETCLHAVMRALYHAWRWQQRAARRNLFPRAALRGLAHLDRMTRAGRPWDLMVAAVKQR